MELKSSICLNYLKRYLSKLADVSSQAISNSFPRESSKQLPEYKLKRYRTDTPKAQRKVPCICDLCSSAAVQIFCSGQHLPILSLCLLRRLELFIQQCVYAVKGVGPSLIYENEQGKDASAIPAIDALIIDEFDRAAPKGEEPVYSRDLRSQLCNRHWNGQTGWKLCTCLQVDRNGKETRLWRICELI